MPIYEYHCTKCGDFEVMQRISDKELRTCPTCRRKVTKLISNTTFHLKGSGWYITDYARKGKGKGEADKKSEPSTESKSGSKSESKSESGTSGSDSKTSKSGGSSNGKKGTKAKSAA